MYPPQMTRLAKSTQAAGKHFQKSADGPQKGDAYGGMLEVIKGTEFTPRD